jgi:hypothetical protein
MRLVGLAAPSLGAGRDNGEALTNSEHDEGRGRPVLFQPIVVASAVFTVLVWVTAFKQAMLVPLSHDEHQFVAAGRLTAEGLLIYRDFPSNHMPYLAFIYAAIFKATDWDLLPARAVSAVSAALGIGLVFALTSSFFRGRSNITRFALAAASSLALMTNPLFRYTSGRAWNHDLPTLLTLAAVAVFLRGKSGRRLSASAMLSGALVGMAAGTRLTYLLALVPFLLAILLDWRPDDGPRRWTVAGAFSAGSALASLPWIALFGLAPRQFIFGNITYQTLNTDYRELLAHSVGQTLVGKVVFFYHVLVDEPANLLLFLVGLVAVTCAAVWLVRRKSGIPRELALLGGLALILCVGAFVATPSWYQYFYAPIPFLILAGMFAISYVWPAQAGWEKALAWLAALIMVVGGIALVTQGDWPFLRETDRWIPVQAHDLGVEMARRVGQGKVLTLSPIFPLEGDLGIYPSLATGPFSWRVAPLLAESQRREFGLLSYSDLNTALRDDPPAGIMVGFEAGNEGFERGTKGGLEAPLANYAKEHGYSPVTFMTPLMEHEVILWLR